MKKLIAIALLTSLTAGTALQAKEKPTKQQHKNNMFVPTKQIVDPKELNKQIHKITAKIRKAIRKRDSFVNDRTRAANKGDQKQVQELTAKIGRKDTKIVKHRALLRMYTLRLAAIKAKDMKKERTKKSKKMDRGEGKARKAKEMKSK